MGIWAAKAPAWKPRCARCKRPFKPTKEGQKYGPTCERKMELKAFRVVNEKGEVTAVIV